MQKLISINKHVRTDGIREYYLHPTRQTWLPGYYDGSKFVWTRTRKYAARHRDYTMADGSTLTVRLSRYTTGYKLRPADAPKGKTGRVYKRAYLETCGDVYYREGRFFVTANILVNDKWTNSLIPSNGTIRDAYSEQSERAGIPDVEITCKDGYPVAVEMDGITYPVEPGQWEDLYAPVLQIKDVEQVKQAA